MMMYKFLVQVYKCLELNMLSLLDKLAKVMSEYKREIVIAVVLAVILVASIALVSSYFFQQTQPPIPPPPTPMPTPVPTPVPTLGPAPPPAFHVKADLDSAQGFSYVTKESQGHISKVLVLPPGGSGTIPVTLTSKSDDHLAITLSIEPEGVGDARLFKGIRFTFSPTFISLKPGETTKSVLKVEVEPSAPTGFYGPSVLGSTEEIGLSSSEAYFNLLILPYTPSYLFYIYSIPPGPPPLPTPEGEETPPPTPPPSPPETTTPVPTPPTVSPSPPTLPPPPTIEVETGGEVYVMFGIETFSEDPGLPVQLNYTYNSKPAGSLPSGVSADLVSNPLQVVRVPIEERFYLLTLSAGPDASEGTYEIVVTGSVGSYTFERSFYLLVKSS